MAGDETRTLRIGISACLLGEPVRYDGGHKRDAFLADVLAEHVEWVPVCPEVELGLGVPRPPMRLARGGRSTTRLVVKETGEDLTARMRAYATWRARGLASLELDGYVLKSKSPSCGLARVPVHDADDDLHGGLTAEDPQTPSPNAVGRGLFAEALAEALPLIPMEDERRLARTSVREHFVDRLLAAARWRGFVKRRARAGDLVAFHAAHKYALLAHSPTHYETLGRLVATVGRRRLADVVADYAAAFAAAYAVPATRGRHVNALEHMASFFTRALSDDQRAELATAIADYRRGATALADPLALIREHAHRLGVAHLTEQVYLRSRTICLPSRDQG
ncbi:MAG TPA: DUF523 and DUF1722 domain-containing protein [Methylomirabilota bacterium]|nr:DUF523 and DUF1722 domain-containing protein [Methylomirabilota bacterium]